MHLPPLNEVSPSLSRYAASVKLTKKHFSGLLVGIILGIIFVITSIFIAIEILQYFSRRRRPRPGDYNPLQNRGAQAGDGDIEDRNDIGAPVQDEGVEGPGGGGEEGGGGEDGFPDGGGDREGNGPGEVGGENGGQGQDEGN